MLMMVETVETAETAQTVTIKGLLPAPPASTREAYIHAVRDLAVAYLEAEPAVRARLLAAKLVYGVGSQSGARGVCYYDSWHNGDKVEILEVAASAEESLVQLAGTTIHETAHALAGHAAGHGPEWKAACKRLGLIAAEAAGQSYAPEHFDACLWDRILKLPLPTDGEPVFATATGNGGGLAGLLGILGGLRVRKPRPCPMGVGTRGGRSRGTGSGSRMRLFECRCERPRKMRMASDESHATCNLCGHAFERKS